jgi:hypothetical protein
MQTQKPTATCTTCKKQQIPAKKHAFDPETCPTCTAKNIAQFLARNNQTPCQ